MNYISVISFIQLRISIYTLWYLFICYLYLFLWRYRNTHETNLGGREKAVETIFLVLQTFTRVSIKIKITLYYELSFSRLAFDIELPHLQPSSPLQSD